jgi:hypothetical protein
MMKKGAFVAISFLAVFLLSWAAHMAKASSPLTVTIPYEFYGTLTVDGTKLTGTNPAYSVKFTKEDGSEYKDQAGKAWSEYTNPDGTAKNTFGTVPGYSGYYVYRVPIYDATDVKEGAPVGATVYIHVYKGSQELIVLGTSTATVGQQGEATELNLSVRTPVPALSMTYDSKQIESGGTIDFGEVLCTGGGSKTYTITFTNTGDEGTTLNITNINVTGTGADAFTVDQNELHVPKGASSGNKLDIKFTPSAEQTYNATLTFKANTGTAGADVEVTINLTGKGIPEPVAIFSPSVTTDKLDFGIVKVGSSSEKTVTITNAGGYNLVLSQGTIEGTDKGQFSLSSDTCSGKTIAPNGSCSITIKFSPTSTGAKTAVAKILSNSGKTGADKDNPTREHTLTLSGTGGIGQIVVPTSLDFGEVLVGEQKQLNLVVQNNGSYELSVTNITLPAGYTVDKNSARVPPNGTETFVVTFSPTSAVAYSGKITIFSDDPDSPQKEVTVTGTGTNNAVALDKTSINFGTVILPDRTMKEPIQGCSIAGNTVSCSLTIQNISPDDLQNIVLTVTGAQFGVSQATLNINRGQSQTVQVTYQATSSKTAHTGKLTVTPPAGASSEVSLVAETNTRPNQPLSPSVENADTLTPTLKVRDFEDPDGDTHLGTKWIIKDASGNTVFVTSSLGKDGKYTEVCDKNNLTTFVVPKGVLKYNTSYKFQAKFCDSRELESEASNEFSFTTPEKPANVDDYGVPITATQVTYKDTSGKDQTVTNLNAGTDFTGLKNTQSFTAIVPQIGTVEKVVNAGKLDTISLNTNNVSLVKTDGGSGTQAMVMIPEAESELASIMPIDTGGKTLDPTDPTAKNKTTALSKIDTSGVSLPYGLFDIVVNLAPGPKNSTSVVIIPPTPFAKETKWYKYDPSDGKVKEYPNFTIDANGNGVLILTDNGAGDMDGTQGVIRDPGGPGVPVAGTTGETTSKGGCFIATAAFGSYFDPYVQILRAFRDTFLLNNSLGRAFVDFYYRISPPIADFIRESEGLKAATRVFLMPAVGFSILSLKIGLLPALTIVFCTLFGFVFFLVRRKK